MNIVERQERLLGGVGVGRFRVVDEQHPVEPADLFHAMREPRECLERARDAIALDAESPRGGVGERGVLPVMRAAKRPRARKIGRWRGFPSGHHAMLADPDVGERRLRARHRNDAGHASARFQSRIDLATGLVVHADQRDLGLRDKPLLDGGVAGEIAMPVEMVRRDVDEESDGWLKRGREVDLVGRTFNDMDAPRRGRRKVEDRHADIAAHRNLASGLLKHMGDERGGRRFAIGAGDGDKRRAWRPRAALPHEELDIADDRNPRIVRKVHRPMRLRMGQRHAGREHKHPEAAPVGVSEIDQRHALGFRALPCRGTIVPRGDLSAAGDKRVRRRQSRPAEAEESDPLSAQGLDRRHRHLSLREARPTIASTKAMIQKRMTICGSDQPSCSKW